MKITSLKDATNKLKILYVDLFMLFEELSDLNSNTTNTVIDNIVSIVDYLENHEEQLQYQTLFRNPEAFTNTELPRENASLS